MGMYSSLIDEEIEVIDKDGLKEYLVKNADEDYGVISVLWDKKDVETFSFNGWDNHKIIQYWYAETLETLRDLAVFIDGYCKFEYETGEEFGIITFKDGKCILDLGVVKYTKYNPEDLWHSNNFEDGEKMPPLSDELNARLVGRKL